MIPRIRQVQIQHYKSLDHSVVDLEPFTVLVGPNGAGKSNFVDALMFVQESLSLSVSAAWNNRGGQLLRTIHRTDSVAFGFRFLLDLSADTTAEYSLAIVPKLLGFDVERERCVIRNSRSSTGFEVVKGRFEQEIPGIKPALAADRLALVAVSALDEYRPLYDFLASIRAYSIDPGQLRGWQALDPGEFLTFDGSNATSILKRLEMQSDGRLERICRLLARVVPGIDSISVVVKDREASLGFRQNLGELNAPFDSREMSDGTLRILGLLLAAYQPNRPSVLIVEEPEATVHPAAAELITQVLLDAAQDRQVLVTTHSPDILDFKELSDQQIRAVSMERGHTVVAPLSQASRQAIRERLYTPGELLRMNELNADLEAADRASQTLDLFGEVASIPLS